jgi:hypothetical protein
MAAAVPFFCKKERRERIRQKGFHLIMPRYFFLSAELMRFPAALLLSQIATMGKRDGK